MIPGERAIAPTALQRAVATSGASPSTGLAMQLADRGPVQLAADMAFDIRHRLSRPGGAAWQRAPWSLRPRQRRRLCTMAFCCTLGAAALLLCSGSVGNRV